MSEKKKLLSTKEAAEYCGFKLSYFRFKAFILEQTLCTWSSPYNIERESIPMWFRVIVEFLQLISIVRQANVCGLQKHATH